MLKLVHVSKAVNSEFASPGFESYWVGQTFPVMIYTRQLDTTSTLCTFPFLLSIINKHFKVVVTLTVKLSTPVQLALTADSRRKQLLALVLSENGHTDECCIYGLTAVIRTNSVRTTAIFKHMFKGQLHKLGLLAVICLSLPLPVSRQTDWNSIGYHRTSPVK